MPTVVLSHFSLYLKTHNPVLIHSMGFFDRWTVQLPRPASWDFSVDRLSSAITAIPQIGSVDRIASECLEFNISVVILPPCDASQVDLLVNLIYLFLSIQTFVQSPLISNAIGKLETARGLRVSRLRKYVPKPGKTKEKPVYFNRPASVDVPDSTMDAFITKTPRGVAVTMKSALLKPETAGMLGSLSTWDALVEVWIISHSTFSVFTLSLQGYRSMGCNIVHVTSARIPRLLSNAVHAHNLRADDMSPTDFLVTDYSFIRKVSMSEPDVIFVSIPSLAHISFAPKLSADIQYSIDTHACSRFIIFCPSVPGEDARVRIMSIFTSHITSRVHVIVL